jgi:hypothetical protein
MVVLAVATGLSVIAALASLLRGGRYVHPDSEPRRPNSGNPAVTAPPSPNSGKPAVAAPSRTRSDHPSSNNGHISPVSTGWNRPAGDDRG